MPIQQAAPLLAVRHLNVRFITDALTFDAVTDVSFTLTHGQIFCLVGESGCGKSLTAKAILRLVPENAHIAGDIVFEGDDLSILNDTALRSLRGRRIAMIFQEPMTSLNPVLRVGDQVAEVLRLHMGMNEQAAKERCVELFASVGIPSPTSRLDAYPHQLSGGMRQRIMIAMALACTPALLLADEPTTALDVTIQGQILRLLHTLSREYGMAVLCISHDLGVVADVADAVGVMYAGLLVERASAEALFAGQKHPYTQGLMRAAPTVAHRHSARLPVIRGTVPSPGQMPPGCPFHPRCDKALGQCAQHIPPDMEIAPNHKVRCWLYL